MNGKTYLKMAEFYDLIKKIANQIIKDYCHLIQVHSDYPGAIRLG